MPNGSSKTTTLFPWPTLELLLLLIVVRVHRLVRVLAPGVAHCWRSSKVVGGFENCEVAQFWPRIAQNWAQLARSKAELEKGELGSLSSQTWPILSLGAPCAQERVRVSMG